MNKPIKLTPTEEHKLPYDDRDEQPKDFAEALQVAATTAEVKTALGAVPEATKESVRATENLAKAIQAQNIKALSQPATALAANAFLKEYAKSLAYSVADIRLALLNKLLEIADCGVKQYELRAIELLGKHSDIGLFTERSEVTISYKDPIELEEAIKERVKRLVGHQQKVGLDMDLTTAVDAEYEELGIPKGQKPAWLRIELEGEGKDNEREDTAETGE